MQNEKFNLHANSDVDLQNHREEIGLARAVREACRQRYLTLRRYDHSMAMYHKLEEKENSNYRKFV